MEETTILQVFLTDFKLFYVSLRIAFWPFLIQGMEGFAIFGVLRIIVKYAIASPIGNFDQSSYVCRCIEYILYRSDNPEARKAHTNYDENHKYIGIKGAHLGGAAIDIAFISAFLSILAWVWPAILIITILFGPLQLCRNHFMKKKKFIANLKGEELDI